MSWRKMYWQSWARFWRSLIGKPEFGGSWRERERRADDTSGIRFGCDWRNGQCKAERIGYRENCCAKCWVNHGYLETIPARSVDSIEKLYDRKHKWGFWRPGVGCILPRKWRSQTCLTFFCVPCMSVSERRRLVRIIPMSEGAAVSVMIDRIVAARMPEASGR